MRALAASLLAGLQLGCFVLDELDAADELMNEVSPTAKAEKKQQAEEADTETWSGSGVSEKEQASRERIRDWWANARTFEPDTTPKPPNERIVRCQLRGESFLTRRGECLSRGGQPAGR